jgi:hypothetical protein
LIQINERAEPVEEKNAPPRVRIRLPHTDRVILFTAFFLRASIALARCNKKVRKKKWWIR